VGAESLRRSGEAPAHLKVDEDHHILFTCADHRHQYSCLRAGGTFTPDRRANEL
jgi:hypothetical protein